jgi:hypothetical protein
MQGQERWLREWDGGDMSDGVGTGIWAEASTEADSNSTLSETLVGSDRSARDSEEEGLFIPVNGEQQRAAFFFGPRT